MGGPIDDNSVTALRLLLPTARRAAVAMVYLIVVLSLLLIQPSCSSRVLQDDHYYDDAAPSPAGAEMEDSGTPGVMYILGGIRTDESDQPQVVTTINDP